VVRNLKDTVRVLLQGKPRDFDLATFAKQVVALEGVAATHDMHAWSLDGIHNVLSMHVVLDRRGEDVPRIKREIQDILRGHGEFHVTIETEFAGEICHDNCDE
jgi:cobalt-zinc-cadmium efflux system protein